MAERDERPWIKLSLDYFENPKIDILSDSAQLLHLSLILRSARQRTDGIVTARACQARGAAPFRELVKHGRLVKNSDGTYTIHDYVKHQTDADTIAAKVRQRAVSGSRGGHKKNHENRFIFSVSCEHCQKAVQNGESWLEHAEPAPKT